MGTAGGRAHADAADVADVAAASTAGYSRLDEVQGSNYLSDGLKGGSTMRETTGGTRSSFSWRVIFCTFLITLLLVAFRVRRAEVTTLASKCVFNLFLARHCDKNPPWAKVPTKMELCTEQGYLRGEHMAAEFGPEGQYPMPNRLYARRLKRGVYTSRDLFLLWPLAQRLRLLVNTTFDEGGALGLVQSLESEREAQCLSGRSEETVLVAWDHCSLPALAQALGCDEETCLDCWDDGNFEKLLWLRFTAVPKSKQKLSWNLTTRAVSEHFAPPQGFMGYRECLGNPAESSNYGFACKPLQAWKSLPNDLTGLH